PYEIEDIDIPSSAACIKVIEYARTELPEPTFNHSMRVYYWGMALMKNYNPWELKNTEGLAESFLLSCMLHDIGTAPQNIKSTRLSFELWGAIKARELLPTFGAHEDQADLVAEVINRHQDLGEHGAAPAVLGLIYFGTLFDADNIGANAKLIHPSTLAAVVKEFPRIKWTSCFAATIREEVGAKPWAHTTVIDKFAETVEAN
ncbi:cyanamide hydratase, partial [Microthyrium microscopicum]